MPVHAHHGAERIRMVGNADFRTGCVIDRGAQAQRLAGFGELDRDRHQRVIGIDVAFKAMRGEARRRRPGDLGARKVCRARPVDAGLESAWRPGGTPIGARRAMPEFRRRSGSAATPLLEEGGFEPSVPGLGELLLNCRRRCIRAQQGDRRSGRVRRAARGRLRRFISKRQQTRQMEWWISSVPGRSCPPSTVRTASGRLSSLAIRCWDRYQSPLAHGADLVVTSRLLNMSAVIPT